MAAKEKEDFKALQKAFARHLRSPSQHRFDHGIEPRRVKVYQDLIRNNLRSFLNSAFPVTPKAIGQAAWDALIADFQASHYCSSPYFTDISAAFVDYISAQSATACVAYPYIKALVHYERVEVDVALRGTPEAERIVTPAVATSTALALNPSALILNYQYPVHEISEKHQPHAPLAEGQLLVVYKNTKAKVCFLALNPLTAMLLNHLQKHGPLHCAELVQHMSGALPDLPAAQIEAGLTETLQAFCENELVLSDKTS